jgi:hypothetical protein
MFLGGAGLADVMLYCRERIYPLGLPNSVSHFITAVAVVLRQVFGWRASFLPPEPAQLSVSVRREGAITGRFAFLFVYPEIETNPYAYTMGMADILEAKSIYFLANKSKKAEIIKKAVQGFVTEEVPASVLQKHQKVTVVLDNDSAALLK